MWINIGGAQANYMHEHRTEATQADYVQYMSVEDSG